MASVRSWLAPLHPVMQMLTCARPVACFGHGDNHAQLDRLGAHVTAAHMHSNPSLCDLRHRRQKRRRSLRRLNEIVVRTPKCQIQFRAPSGC